MANNRKKGSSAGVVFALLMLIVIVIALVIVLRSCSAQNGGEGSSSTPPANTETVVNSPENTPAQPSGTPAGESAPPSPSAAPSETPEPTPSPTPAPANASGTLRSNTGTSLNIVADWQLNGTTLTVNVSAESYSLYSQGAWHAGEVTVGGQTYYFDTQAIEYDGPGQGTNPLGSVTINNVSLGAAISVSWHFRGTYGGTELETITAAGSLA